MQAAQRMHQRDLTGESVQAIADEFGVVKQTLYVWRNKYR
ncbi:helix-turn-helix domain-containing protein [Yersinia alsatica]